MSRALVIATTAAEAHLEDAQNALEDAKELIATLTGAPDAWVSDARMLAQVTRELREKLNIYRKRIP